MLYFTLAYFAILIGTSALAAYYGKRTTFILVFAFTLVSLVVGVVAKTDGLFYLTGFALFIIFSLGISYCFREFLITLSSPNLAKELRTVPISAAFGMFVVLVYAIAGIFAPWIAPYGQADVISEAFAPADQNLLLGADQLGRDIFSRLVYGARNTVGLALAATSLAFLMGALAGLYAATRGGWVDQLFGRISDIVMSIPSLIFALLMLSVFGTSLTVIVLVIAVIYSPRVYRLTRAVAGNIVVMDYIEAARLRGEGTWYLIRGEVLPNSTAPLIVEFGLEFCFVFLLIAGLSFLGLGIQPPTADWGSMVRENALLISFGEMTPLIPAAAIALLTVAVNLIVDWMLYRTSGLKEQ